MNQKILNITYGVVIVILIGAVVYFAVGKKSEPTNNSTNQTNSTNTPLTNNQQNTSTPTSSTPTPPTDWHAYNNTQYGFQLTLADVWKGYKVFQRNDVVYSDVKYLDFGVPTSGNPNGMFGDTNSNGFAAPFGIAVYPKAEWAKISKEDGPKPTYITQNSQYVFGYYQWQDSPDDLINVDFGIPQVISSFKLTNTANPTWKESTYNQLKNLTDWKVEENLSDWRLIDLDPSQLNKFSKGKIFEMSKGFNDTGFPGPNVEQQINQAKAKQTALENAVKKVLADNGWKFVVGPTEGGFYHDYLYVKDNHPLILQIGTRDAVIGMMYISIQFQY